VKRTYVPAITNDLAHAYFETRNKKPAEQSVAGVWIVGFRPRIRQLLNLFLPESESIDAGRTI
jgi:hypothetical protein